LSSILCSALMFAEPSPLHTATIVEKCTQKLVDEYNHMLTQATEPLSTFLEYIT
jgi:V-type H+-transporting ATPase subunit d